MPSRTQIYLLCCLFGNSSLSLAADSKPAQNVPSLGTVRNVECEAEDRLIGLLNKTIRAEWSNVSLADALKSISAQHEIEIWIDHVELKDEEAQFDQKVDVHLGDATVWQALHFLIRREPLAWTPSAGRLLITSPYEASYRFRTRIYDVKRLVEAFEPGLRTMRGRHIQSPGYFGGRGGMSFFSIREVPVLLSLLGENASPFTKEQYGVAVDPRRNIVENRLIELLSAMWFPDFDTQNMSIEAGDQRLVVRASHEQHFRIQGMLQALESFVTEPANVHQFLVRRPHYPHAEDALIFQALAKAREFDSQNLTLRAVLSTLAKEHAIRLHIDDILWTSAKLSLDAPVAIRTSKSPLSTILHRLLDPHLLAFYVEEGTLIITTRDEVEKLATVALYHLKGIPDTEDPSQFLETLKESVQDLEQAVIEDRMFLFSSHCLAIQATPGRQALYEDLLNRWCCQPSAAVKPREPSLETRIYPVGDSLPAEDLISALPDLIPGWDSKQKIRKLGNTLVIKQLPLVHERLEQVLKALNTFRSNP